MVDIFAPDFLNPEAPASSGGSTDESVQRSPTSTELTRQLDRQRLVIEVLVRALIEKGLYTREQLNALANLVDMEDGIRDGRMRPKKEVRVCSKCGRVLFDVSAQCLYCGYHETMEIV